MLSKRMIAGVTAALLMLAATVVYAGRGMGMGGCNENVSIENFKQFQKDTSTLRDEMMVKRIEMQREQAAKTPDQAKVAALKQEMTSLKTQIHEAGKKYGMFTGCDEKQECWNDGGCGMMDGGCGKSCGKNCGADCSKDCAKAKCDKKGCNKQAKKKSAGCNSCNKKAK